MVKAKSVRRIAVLHEASRRLEQCIGADDIGFDKSAGAVNGSVNMGFSGQMHNGVRGKVRHQGCHGRLIANVLLGELISLVISDVRDIFQIGRIGELVHIQDMMAVGNRFANDS